MVNKGFSVLELILVISIIALLTGMATPFVGGYLLRNNWHVTTDRVASEVYKAQANAMDGANGATWGVCVTGGLFRLFAGSCASPTIKEDFVIPNGVAITGITSLTFGNLRGEPSTPSTISIVTDVGTSTVVLNAAGMVEVN